MLIFAALVPHPPLLIPNTNISETNLEQINVTQRSTEALLTKLASLKPDTIIVISGHSSFVDNISINISSEYESNFQEFGNFNEPFIFNPDLELIAQIRELFVVGLEQKLVLMSSVKIDHGISIPLYYLNKLMDDYKIVPMAPMISELKYNFLFGNMIQDEILKTNKRVAIIVSGDLAHVPSNSSISSTRLVKKFNEQLIKSILKKDIDTILNIDAKLRIKVGECTTPSLLILLGILKDVNCAPTLLSYESAFGVGYVTIEFSL